MVAVHEGLEPESTIPKGQEEEHKSKRWRLKNPHYFCKVCSGKENAAFWDEIFEYLNSQYDIPRAKKIYLNADGVHGLRQVLKE